MGQKNMNKLFRYNMMGEMQQPDMKNWISKIKISWLD